MKNLILIDDNPLELAFNKRVILSTLKGYITISAASAREGYHKILYHRPAIVISDFEMPGETGLDLYHKLHQRVLFPFYFILISTLSKEQVLRSAPTDRPPFFIQKPLRPYKLTYLHDQLLAKDEIY